MNSKCLNCQTELTNKTQKFCNDECHLNYYRERGIYTMSALSIIRELVKLRANRLCEKCGIRQDFSKGIKLHMHHLQSKEEFPELALDMRNIICVCQQCHAKMHVESRKMEVSNI